MAGSGTRRFRFGFEVRITLIVLAILSVSQALGTYLNVLSFEREYLKSISAKYEILGKSLKRKIEQSLKFGKRLDNFVGLDRLAVPLFKKFPDLDEIFLADAAGKKMFSSGIARIVMAKQFSVPDGDGDKLLLGQYETADTIPVEAPMDWESQRPVLRFLGGRYHLMLPVSARFGKDKAILGIIFNRSAIEAGKLALMREARTKLIITIVGAGLLIGLLVRFLFVRPAQRQISRLQGGGATPMGSGAPMLLDIPAELLEVNLSIVDYVNHANRFRREMAETLDALARTAQPESGAAFQISEMKRLLSHETQDTQS